MQRYLLILGLFVVSAVPLRARAQSPSSAGAPAPDDSHPVSAGYPHNRAGIMIGDRQWTDIANQVPSKTRAAHGIAASLSYGIVPAKIVAEYQGDHSSTRTTEPQPVICICHFNSLPGSPVLVRLHPKKDSRELDGGKMIVYPLVGGAKMADANKTDLIPVDVSQPEPQVWLVRPQAPLDPGEYALMLGTQNMSIFPFTIDAPPDPSPR